MKTINIKCTECNKEFEMLHKHYKYNTIKKGQNPFCSKRCIALYSNKHKTKKSFENCYQHLNPGNKRDKFSPFRVYIKQCKIRNKEHHVDLDLDVEYLKQLWENQNGTCPYTNIKMILPPTTNAYYTYKSLLKASLDRIDSSKGYIKGNVEFVCMFINYGKNSYDRNEVVDIIKKIKNGQDGGT